MHVFAGLNTQQLNLKILQPCCEFICHSYINTNLDRKRETTEKDSRQIQRQKRDIDGDRETVIEMERKRETERMLTFVNPAPGRWP